MAGTGVGKYSTTAANNAAVQSTNWAEGMAPSDVNNAARETLANVRAAVNDIAAGYVELGDTDGEYTVTKIDADTFTINTAVDLRTDYYQVGRKIKITHSNGTTTGNIESTAYSSPTLTVNLTGANITGASITKVELGLPNPGGAADFDLDDNAKVRMGDSQDFQLYHDSSNSYITNSTGDLLVDVANDIVLDADGADVRLLDGGTQFGQFSNVSSNLKILSGSTVAATFSGANVTFAGTINSGAITSSGEITAFSDQRLKSNIETIDNALEKISNMRGVYFTKDGEEGTGVIAQEVEKVLPEVVKDGEYKSVAYGNMIGVLIEAVKELKEKVDKHIEESK